MKEKNKNQDNEKGITLIALIVTIIIMTILAGITIKLAISDNGIVNNAKEAKEQYEESQINVEKETTELANNIKNNFEKIKTGASIGDPTEGVPIPEGFFYVGGTKESGLVISDDIADKEKYKWQTIVGTDLVGNQFVWIPVDDIEDYKRTAYLPNTSTGEIDEKTNSEKINFSAVVYKGYFRESLPTDEKQSVEKNKGYYIGRYEAGDRESTENKTLRTSGASISGIISIKAGQSPYNWIRYAYAKSLSEGFSEKQGYKGVTSKLVSSYAWDTAIAFIQKTNKNYGNSSEGGNYKDTEFTYKDITGALQVKIKETAEIIPTGQTTPEKNIYDMGGNVLEYTTEGTTLTGNRGNPYTPSPARGGSCTSTFAGAPAGARIPYSGETGRTYKN